MKRTWIVAEEDMECGTCGDTIPEGTEVVTAMGWLFCQKCIEKNEGKVAK